MKSEKKKRTLEDHIIEKIKESGYPLEIEVSNLLDTGHYVVFNSQYYFDAEEKRGRDLDIYAMPLAFEEPDKKFLPLRIRTEIAIECKKSETHAWVFYNRQNIPVSGHHISGQFKTSVPKPTKFSPDNFQWILQNCLTLHYYEFERVAIAFDEIKKKRDGSSRREIFGAINQLVKFTCYEIHQIFDRISKLPKPLPYKEIILLFFPIIVFDGDMFEVTFDYGEPRLEKKNHIILQTNYRCPRCLEVESFIVDVVHRSYFHRFMKILDADFNIVRKNVIENIGKLVESAEWTRIACETETNESQL